MPSWIIPDGLLYDRNNLWIWQDGNEALVGLSQYGQFITGDILFLDCLPEGTWVERGQGLGSIESGKWVGRLLSPLTGTVRKINPAVQQDPGLVNRDPYDQGWLLRIQLEEPEHLEQLMGTRLPGMGPGAGAAGE